MKWYFVLQFKMLNRHLKDFGIPTLLIYPTLVSIFLLLSNFVFYAVGESYASYVYLFIAISVIIKLGERKRNDFLKLSFTQKKYASIRALENVLLATPFALYLIYEKEYWYIVYLYLVGLLLSKFTLDLSTSYTIPTPFGKKPFEFSLGFRNTFFLYPIIYFLTYKSIEVKNFNLGIFSLLLLFVLLISYYTKIENRYFVWMFKYTPKTFLIEKIKTGVIYALFSSAPIVVSLGVFFYDYIGIIIVVQLLCFLYLIQAIIAKYCDFPMQITLPNSMIFGMSMSFLPLALLTFRYFYRKSIQNLTSVLNDKH
ncbi:hypothetical protein [Tenacibaculum agarivorans]|uniref:hypothetical protein n=1 Tax=Tenacibaculum agarivorans TaxID=1908389 RepID=UPI00094B86A2|nr:hypothetical protein [Tenacibaculum agarivorans]